MCVLSGMGGQNDKVHLKIFKLFRIIPTKKKNFGGGGGKAPLGPVDHPPLLTLLNASKENIHGSNASLSL